MAIGFDLPFTHLWYCILFLYNVSVGAAGRLRNICCVYGKDIMSLRTVKDDFREEGVDDKARTGRPIQLGSEILEAELKGNSQ